MSFKNTLFAPEQLKLKPNHILIYSAIITLEFKKFKSLEDRIKEIAQLSFSNVTTVRSFIHNPKNHLEIKRGNKIRPEKRYQGIADANGNYIYFNTFFKAIKKLTTEKQLTITDVLIYLKLIQIQKYTHWKRCKTPDKVYPSIETIAKWMNISRTTVITSLRRLKQVNLLNWHTEEQFKSNVYDITPIEECKKIIKTLCEKFKIKVEKIKSLIVKETPSQIKRRKFTGSFFMKIYQLEISCQP